MATGRMLRRTVSTCEQLADCSLLARLLYTWGIAHSSDWGVLKTSPRKLKAQVFPLSDETADDVYRATAELISCGLWIAFTDGEDDFIYYPTFEKYQSVPKRTESQRDGLPLPPNHVKIPEVPGSSKKLSETPPQEKGRKEKGREGKGTAPTGAPEAPLPEHVFEKPEPKPKRLIPKPLPPVADTDPADFEHVDSCQSEFTQAFVRYFNGSKAPEVAQGYAQLCRQQLRVPNAGLTEDGVMVALREGNGPQGKEWSDNFGPETYLARLLREKREEKSAEEEYNERAKPTTPEQAAHMASLRHLIPPQPRFLKQKTP